MRSKERNIPEGRWHDAYYYTWRDRLADRINSSRIIRQAQEEAEEYKRASRERRRKK